MAHIIYLHHQVYQDIQVVSVTAVFTDTRADTSSLYSSGIPETLDQPTNISNYYLHKIMVHDNSYTLPLKIRSDNNLQVYPEADFESLYKNGLDIQQLHLLMVTQ